MEAIVFSGTKLNIDYAIEDLLDEDQQEEICSNMDCWNALTLKQKIHQEEKEMKEFTFCFRLNLLSYSEKAKKHVIFWAKTNKYHFNEAENSFWTTGFKYSLKPIDGPSNGVIIISTFNERLEDILSEDGFYTIWPTYEPEVNANQWNSFCIGSSLSYQNIFLVRNGRTIHNFTQPELWAKLNKGIDTSALGPFQVKSEPKSLVLLVL